MVQFSVATANGDFSGPAPARSSGSSYFDEGSLNVIRSATPFLRPPAGARRSYQIAIKGRG
ncbi:MAG: hypothetical protein OSA82_14230 [Paracoccaceae bacterium]|nr:hypothetical protein [Paracoccaceae bacterium]